MDMNTPWIMLVPAIVAYVIAADIVYDSGFDKPRVIALVWPLTLIVWAFLLGAAVIWNRRRQNMIDLPTATLRRRR